MNAHTKGGKEFQFDLECLEQREMLAVDVSVTLSEGVLTVVGDESSNRIAMVAWAFT